MRSSRAERPPRISSLKGPNWKVACAALERRLERLDAEARSLAMQHPMAVGANESEVRQAGLLAFHQRRNVATMMRLNEPFADFSVPICKVEFANFTG